MRLGLRAQGVRDYAANRTYNLSEPLKPDPGKHNTCLANVVLFAKLNAAGSHQVAKYLMLFVFCCVPGLLFLMFVFY